MPSPRHASRHVTPATSRTTTAAAAAPSTPPPPSSAAPIKPLTSTTAATSPQRSTATLPMESSDGAPGAPEGGALSSAAVSAPLNTAGPSYTVEPVSERPLSESASPRRQSARQPSDRAASASVPGRSSTRARHPTRAPSSLTMYTAHTRPPHTTSRAPSSAHAAPQGAAPPKSAAPSAAPPTRASAQPDGRHSTMRPREHDASSRASSLLAAAATGASPGAPVRAA